MAKYKNDVSPEVMADAEKIAKATQRPGQTKEQTKLITKGIQKGIEDYKKRYKAKARELDKKLKNVKASANKEVDEPLDITTKNKKSKTNYLLVVPWLLLVLSWTYFYLTFTGTI